MPSACAGIEQFNMFHITIRSYSYSIAWRDALKLLAAINVTIKAIKRCTSNREQIKTRMRDSRETGASCCMVIAACVDGPWRPFNVWAYLSCVLVCVLFDTDFKSRRAHIHRWRKRLEYQRIWRWPPDDIGFSETRLNALRAVSGKCPRTHTKYVNMHSRLLAG